MKDDMARQDIISGNSYLGIELGSTRMKAVLIGADFRPMASGGHSWENQLVGGIWTYSLDAVWYGLRECYANLKEDVFQKYGVALSTVGSIGISAMMHGYLSFDQNDNLLVPFRTWRNTMTAESSEVLVKEFDYPIPHRWSISHLYQAILNNEPHVPDISFMTTLAGYVHWKLTGKKVVGIGDASGMFPIDLATKVFNPVMIERFDSLVSHKGYAWKLFGILPEVALAGDFAGALTETGALLLDPSGALKAGIPLCPPEGDAGTGMTATNSVAQRTGNVSAGTSVFLMAVLEKELTRVYPEIDLVTTPVGDLVAMVHCNNCTGDLDAWVKLFAEFATIIGAEIGKSQLYDALYAIASDGESDCGGLLSYNYISGESITSTDEGRPLFLRTPNNRFTLANFLRTHLYSALATLKIGFDILQTKEKVSLDRVYAHGGLFKSEEVGQRILAAAVNTSVTVNETAGEGGAWGMALLAAYARCRQSAETLHSFLDNRVFGSTLETTLAPRKEDVMGFDDYVTRFKAGIPIERSAIANS